MKMKKKSPYAKLSGPVVIKAKKKTGNRSKRATAKEALKKKVYRSLVDKVASRNILLREILKAK